jgi:hypothetical protein
VSITIKPSFLAALFILAAVTGANAKNFAIPDENPVATLSLPNGWKPTDIEHGVEAKSPDGDIYFSAESSSPKGFDSLMDDNVQWMKDNKIRPDTPKPAEKDITYNGMQGHVLSWNAHDEDGATILDFIILAPTSKRLLLLTVWASEQERTHHIDELNGIMASLHPVQ